MHLPSRGAFALLCFAGSLAAQDEPATFTSDTRLVVLHATVIDNKGKLLTNLPREAFKVFENGQPQQLRLFRREDVPVSLGLIIDNSGSMKTTRQKVEAAALAMVKASNPKDEVMVVNYNDEAYEDVPLTSDIKKMEEGLTRIDARGGTAMYDAISMTMDRLKQKGKRDKKVIFLITDGNDNASVTKLEELVRKASNSDIVIHIIGLLEAEERSAARKAKRAVEAIATATGGLFYFPKDLNEVEKISLEVADDIRNQYVLAYSPTIQALDGSFRQIKVTANGPNRPTVRTRSGYYATAGKKPNS
ncbi:MAG: VWA domain-containing protein [Bryobacteraceae bacterium]|nr:VWA domain-containing protein [Bryobacteraceae bacterium]